MHVALSQLREGTQIDDAVQSRYTSFFDYFATAIPNFVEAELNYRQRDRCVALAMEPQLQAYSEGMGQRMNLQGIEALTNGLAEFVEFKNNAGNLPLPDDWQQQAAKAAQDMKQVLLTLELKGSDVSELANAIDDVIAAVPDGSSGAELLDYMESKIQELIDLRQSSGRGAETNLAPWKIVAAAVAVGVAIFIVIKCRTAWFTCSRRERQIYLTVLAVALITFGACE